MVLFGFAGFAEADAALFPEPLHLRREVHDPLAGTTTTIDEYCSSNRIVTVNGSRVAIADYDRGELTEIDRDRRTFSITSFSEIAKAGASLPGRRFVASETQIEPRTRPGKRSADGRSLETWQFVHSENAVDLTLDVAIDRQVALSVAGLEALIGAAFPNRRDLTHDAILKAASPGGGAGRRVQTTAVETFGLPSEYAVTSGGDGQTVTFRSAAIAVDRELAPAHILTIPPGATRVESPLVSVSRMLEEIDNVRPRRP